MNKIITWHPESVSSSERTLKLNHSPATIWMTGLSGSGKSTIAQLVSRELHDNNISEIVLDGDNIRHGLCSNLGFSANDRRENVRRIAEMAKVLNSAGVTVICPVISPYTSDRLMVKDIIGHDNYIEAYCECDLRVCEQRDTKGLYKLARLGRIKNFIGISSPYKPPTDPAITVNTSINNEQESASHVINYLRKTRQRQPIVSV